MMLAGVIAEGWRTSGPLAAWFNALNNVDTAQARMFVIPDSILEGTGASARSARALDLLLAQLVEDYPVAGQGQSQYLPAVYGCPKSGQATNTSWGGLWTTSSSGTITQRLSGIAGQAGTPTNTFGPGMRSVDFSGTNATVTYTLQGTDVDVWFAPGGSFTYSVDGGSFSSAISTASMAANADVYPIHLGSSGSHTLAIRRSSGTIHLLGFMQFDGARDKGVALIEAGHWGAQIIDFWSYSNSSAPQNAKFTRNIQLAAPQLVVINVLINDAGNLGQQGVTECMARLTGMLGAIRAAAPSASVAFVQPYDQVPVSTLLSDGQTVADLKAAVATWTASNNVALIDLSASMPESDTDTSGLYQTDEMHLTDAGNVVAAGLLSIAFDPAYVPPPMTLTGTLGAGAVGVAYGGTLTLGGSFTAPVSFSGQPSWMTLAATGTSVDASGTPDEEGTEAGTITATDADGQTATLSYSFEVTDGATYATLDPSAVVYGVHLSNGNLTASMVEDYGGLGPPLSYGYNLSGAGRYFEASFDTLTGTAEGSIGVGNADYDAGMPGANYNATPIDYGVHNNGDAYASQASLGNLGLSFAAGDSIKFYIAPGGGLYCGKVGGAWVSDPSSGTPLLTLAAGSWRPIVGGEPGTAVTINFGASTWLDTPPTGAVGWAG